MTGGISKFDQEFPKTDTKHTIDHSHRQPGKEYETGQTHSHKTLDSNDQRSINQKLKAESHIEKEQHKQEKQPDAPQTSHAIWHGNEPSRGAKVDDSLGEDDEQALKKKGLA